MVIFSHFAISYTTYSPITVGFILKNLDQDYENAILYLKEGIDTNENGTKDGRFYFNLGDALQRLGRNGEAREVVKKKVSLFLAVF